MATFAENLRTLREARNLSQDALAERAGTSKQVLSRYENGLRVPKISMVEKLANALNVSLSELTGDEEKAAPTPPDGVPKTPEARRISAGIDRMPEELRKSVADFMYKSLSQYFDKED